MPAQRASTPRVPRCCPLGAGPGGAAAAEGGACWRHRFGIRGWTVFFCVLGGYIGFAKGGLLLVELVAVHPPHDVLHVVDDQISSPRIAALPFSHPRRTYMHASDFIAEHRRIALFPSTTHIHPACPTPTRTLRSATRSRCLSGLRLIPLNPTPCRPAPCPQMTVGRQSAPCKRVNEGPGGCIHQPTDRKRGGGDDK